MLTLKPGEFIHAAWAGRGGEASVRYVEVLILSPADPPRLVAIQQEEWSPAMEERFAVSELAARQMKRAVEASLMPNVGKFWRTRKGKL